MAKTIQTKLEKETSELLLSILREALDSYDKFRVVQPKKKKSAEENDPVLLDIQDDFGFDLLSVLNNSGQSEFDTLTNYVILAKGTGEKLLTTSWETKGNGGTMKIKCGRGVLGLVEVSGCWTVTIVGKDLGGQVMFKVGMNRRGMSPEYWITDEETGVEICRMSKNEQIFLLHLNQDLRIESKAICILIGCLIFMQFHARILFGAGGIRGVKKYYTLYAVFVVLLIIVMILLTYFKSQ